MEDLSNIIYNEPDNNEDMNDVNVDDELNCNIWPFNDMHIENLFNITEND